MTVVLSLLIASPALAALVKSGNTMSNKAVDVYKSTQSFSGANHKIYTFITLEEKNLLVRLVRAESIGEPFAGKVEVAVVSIK
ncbi:hypothetical protein ACFVSS_17370 [Peribacillus butanolivorans]|uniref:hypothetical protein n=1 Tax=Peribacillus butanolivorans TaxID=421767 RepID=UPI0036DA5881